MPWAELDNLFTQKMNKTFNSERDELPRNRPKINHAQGVVAKVQWKALTGAEHAHTYTGLYEGDSDALLRMSEGNFDLPEAPGLTPTLALKFTRTGMRSVNHLANVNFEPTTSFDFFANPFLTHVPMF